MAGNDAAAAATPDWELSKENYQPLKAGRKPGGLRDVTAELKQRSTEEQRQSFLDDIQNYKGDDLLDVWLRFIKWTQETFKTGGHKAELLPILERCTRELQGSEQYRADIRYLRVWIQYADCLPDPGDVFSFLKENDIGQGHALFYIAHATYLELRSNYSGADKVYQQGINRLAAPGERLRAKFDEFQHRMARRIQRKAAEQAAAGTLEQQPSHPERQSLAVLGGRRHGRAPAGGLAPNKRKAVATPGRDNAPAGGSLQIFVDDEFAGPSASAPSVLGAPSHAATSSAAGGSAWSQLPAFEAGRKENVQKAGTWAGQRLKQKPTHSAPPAAPLSIPIDPEFEAAEVEEEARRRAEAAAPHLSLRQRLDGGSAGGDAQEALVVDPLRLHRTVPAPPAPTAQAAPAGLRPGEVLACDVDALVGPDSEEQSFEEVRALRWRQQQAAHPPPEVTPCTSAASMELDDEGLGAEVAGECSSQLPDADREDPSAGAQEIETTAVAAPAMSQAAAPVASVAGEPAEAPVEVREDALPTPFDLPSSSVAPAEASPPVRYSSQAAEEALAALASAFQDAPTASDVTMSTRGAFEAVNAMFAQRLPSSGVLAAAAAAGTVEDSSGGMEPTMTLSTKDAFAAINSMFGGPVAAGAALPPGGEPTATISTRAAFEALNAMFAANQAPPAAQPEASPTAPVLFVRQDTGMGSGQVATAAAAVDSQQGLADGGFGIREDTIFINCRAPGTDCGVPTDHTEGFAIREDTVFINRDALHEAAQQSGGGGGGFAIREDTVFITTRPAGSPLGLDIREDTIFINGAAPGAAAPGGCVLVECDDTADLLGGYGDATSPLGLRLHAAEGEQVGRWGFAPGADDTLVFGSAVPAHAEGAAGGPSSSALARGLGDLRLDSTAAQEGEVSRPSELVAQPGTDEEEDQVEGDENAAPAGDRGRAEMRVLRDLQAASALQPLEDGQAAERGVEVEENEEAEAAMAVAPWLLQQGEHDDELLEPDDFQVWVDEQEEQQAAPSPTSAPAVVNPFASAFQGHMLSMLDPPVTQWPGVTAVSAAEDAAAAAAFKAAKRRGPAPCGEGLQLQLAGQALGVQRCIGSGAYATVYQGRDAGGSDVALKVEAPPCPWEWYVCRAVQGRVAPSLRPRFLDPCALLLGPQSSVLVMPRGIHGSLQDLLNLHLGRGQRLEEALVMHLAADLLRTLGALHAAGVIHNDVKPDNLLVTLPGADGDENASPAVQLQLIDFGRSVDLELLPAGTCMEGDCGTDAFRCVEMQEGGQWVWQADAYGAAGVVHCLLFGAYMEVDRVVDTASGASTLRIRSALRRYWAGDVWGHFFSSLLNHRDHAVAPPWEDLAARFERHLGGSREVQRALRVELAKLVAELQGQQ